jgi:hypothetical protein
MYPQDIKLLKYTVITIWSLDSIHTALVWNGIYTWFIIHYGNEQAQWDIPLSISLTVIFTAIPTLIVHTYYVHRIYILSGRRFWLPAPIFILAVLRVCSACACSAQMIRLKNFILFRHIFMWLWSLGLALSSTVDVIITCSLFVLLWKSRSRSLSLNGVIDALILYTLELGSLTAIATIAAMVTWLAVKHNLIFLGLYFAIAKLYCNSMLASLNTREELRRVHAKQSSHHMHQSPVMSPRRQGFNIPSHNEDSGRDFLMEDKSLPNQVHSVKVDVQKSVDIEYDSGHPYACPSTASTAEPAMVAFAHVVQ